MKVVRFGDFVIAPGGFLYPWKYDPRSCILWFLLRPHIPVAILGLGVAARFLKPGVLTGGVVAHPLDHDAQSTLTAALGELDEISQRREARISKVVICNVITVIPVRGRLKGHE